MRSNGNFNVNYHVECKFLQENFKIQFFMQLDLNKSKNLSFSLVFWILGYGFTLLLHKQTILQSTKYLKCFSWFWFYIRAVCCKKLFLAVSYCKPALVARSSNWDIYFLNIKEYRIPKFNFIKTLVTFFTFQNMKFYCPSSNNLAFLIVTYLDILMWNQKSPSILQKSQHFCKLNNSCLNELSYFGIYYLDCMVSDKKLQVKHNACCLLSSYLYKSGTSHSKLDPKRGKETAN